MEHPPRRRVQSVYDLCGSIEKTAEILNCSRYHVTTRTAPKGVQKDDLKTTREIIKKVDEITDSPFLSTEWVNTAIAVVISTMERGLDGSQEKRDGVDNTGT